MPNDMTPTAQQIPKSFLRLPTTSWLRPSSFDKLCCPDVGHWSNPTQPGQFHHHRRFSTFTGHEQLLLSSGVINPTQLQANNAPSVTAPIAYASCRNPNHIRNAYSREVATRKTEASTPGMICLHSIDDVPLAEPAAGAISALHRNSIPNRNQMKKSHKSKNQKFRNRDASPQTKI